MDAHPRYVPADLWYSTEPYIDAEVRKAYFTRIVEQLQADDFPIGSWADKVISDVVEDKEGYERTDLEADAERLQKKFVKDVDGYDVFTYDLDVYAVLRALARSSSRNCENLPPGLLAKMIWFREQHSINAVHVCSLVTRKRLV